MNFMCFRGLILFRLLAMVMLTTGLLFGVSTLASSEEGSIPPLSKSLLLEQPLSFCGEIVPLEDSEVRERMEKELLLCKCRVGPVQLTDIVDERTDLTP
jgi:hypothetical protein